MLRPELAESIGTDRFLREIEIAAQLQHPHILPLYDSGEAAGLLYYVMPLVEGESLADRLARDAQLPIEEALQIAQDIAGALQYAHDRGVVHRDIKPGNVMLTAGHAVVADFGIARAVTAAGGDRITETGMVVGTPCYMSPEQSAGSDAVDGRSDVYALACVLYEMLAGQPPFTGSTVQAVLSQHATATPQALQAIRNTIPELVAATISRALNKAPADRFADAGHFSEALSRHAGHLVQATVGWGKPARMGFGIAAALILVVLGALALRGRGANSTESLGPPKLAVLPFENLGAPEDEFFADGITEEITSRLAEVSGLRVVSRTSAKRYKGDDISIQEVGQALRVEYILEGTVRTDRAPGGEGQVRVTPQLIRVSDDVHVWTNRYDASLAPGEIFGVQGRIAEEVAAALNVTLLAPEIAEVRQIETRDPEAYQLYLQGRFFWDRRDAQSLALARQRFEEAIARDSSYAAAYAGLADAISLQVFYANREVGPAPWTSAETAARRAIALDSNLAAAHSALALTLMYGQWDWEGARRAYDRAMELDPDYAVARYLSSEVFLVERRLDEMIERAREAVDLDPQSAVAIVLVGLGLLEQGNNREALRYFQRGIELQPSFPPTRVNQMIAYTQLGQIDDAKRAAHDQFTLLDPNRPVSDAFVAALVDTFAGRATLETTTRAVHEWTTYGMGNAYAALAFTFAGYADSAFARLDASIRIRTENLPVIMGFFEQRLGSDPRWRSVLERMGLE